MGSWRGRQLAAHLIEWLPEFALSNSERESLSAHNAYRLLVQAARNIFLTEHTERRGEIGELLLHVALRQVFGTIPAISKIFFKDAANDTVKGFDAVHVIALPDRLELWLGEAKFYSNIKDAINEAIATLRQHASADYLRQEFAAITNKLDPTWSHTGRLRLLIHPNVSLDKIFDSIRIPVLLTYESEVVAAHCEVSEQFKVTLRQELIEHHASFAAKQVPRLKVHLFLVPLGAKKLLVHAFDERLRGLQ